MKQPHIFKTDMIKPTIITAQQYGTKISVEIDHSDTDLDELMDAFETLVIGLGYHPNSWKSWIVERAAEYDEEENEKWEEPYTYEDFKRDEEFANLRHRYEDSDELENNFFGDYSATLKQDEDRYAATQEDEDEFEKLTTDCWCGSREKCDCISEANDNDEFDEYGMRIPEDRVSFEWGDEPEDEDNLFEGDEWKANENLKAANERYKSEVKKMSNKKKNKKK
jgi:hypothetical protein